MTTERSKSSAPAAAPSTESVDCVIVGAGIVGLATAHALLEHEPGLSIVLLEKEAGPARHQTGRNSGVLHSGIYYRPGSRKALTCRAGKLRMQRFCEDHGVPYDICGKVIVATEERELATLQTIGERAEANGVQAERIGPERLRELEPHATGLAALHVPEAGIVDYSAVCARLAQSLAERGAELRYSAPVLEIERRADTVAVVTGSANLSARVLVSCAGLHSDRVTRRAGVVPKTRIVPFRGEYYELVPNRRHLVQNLIYPVPDPRFPFLGVHFTRRIDDSIECGPNAVLALAREGYRWRDVVPRDLFEVLFYSGFQRLAWRHWRSGAAEMWRSFSRGAFARALARLVPEVVSADLRRAPAGVRAQAVHADGALEDDFLIQAEGRAIFVQNAPSPAATASLEIGRMVAEPALAVLGLAQRQPAAAD